MQATSQLVLLRYRISGMEMAIPKTRHHTLTLMSSGDHQLCEGIVLAETTVGFNRGTSGPETTFGSE